MLVHDKRNPLTVGLVFDVPMFERGGTTVRDFVSKANGTLTNSPTWAMTPYGKCVVFADGSTNVSLHTSQTRQNSLTKVTVEALVYATSYNANDSRIIHKGPDTLYFAISGRGASNANALVVNIGAATPGVYQTSANTLVLNQWNHIAVTMDLSASNIAPIIYINGISMSVTTTTASAGAMAADTTDLGIGNRPVTKTLSWVSGILYVRMWNRILTANEIKELYSNPWQIYRNWKTLPQFQVSSPDPFAVDVLAVGGGGGGNGGVAGDHYGGAGAGGIAVYKTAYTIAVGTYAVTVGTSGTAANQATGGVGGNSVFGTITATGGSGNIYTSIVGGSNASYSGGTGTSGAPNFFGGGGAGAGANGSVNNGGSAYSNSITGAAVKYGGGGAASLGTYEGGGGYGCQPAGTDAGGNGTPNTGGGGGGGASTLGGGNGATGVVILRYLTSKFSGYTITGGSSATDGNYTVRTFTTNDNFIVIPVIGSAFPYFRTMMGVGF